MDCAKRGSVLPEDAAFCTNCGAKVDMSQQSAFVPVVLAGRGARMGAVILDTILVLVPYAFLLLGAVNKDLLAVAWVFAGIGWMAVVTVQVYYLTSIGQSIGKRCLDIRIVRLETDENGGFVTNVLVRGVLNGLLCIIPLYGLIDALFVFRDDRRCIHDLIAKTRVVRCEK